ncbi:hypothetical protein BH10ACI4_BH10ACI4_01140 [soil metagenome]
MVSEIRATSWRKTGLALVLAAAGFAGVAGIIHLLVGNGLRLHADMRSEKLMVMDEWQGRAYTAVFGSSHVHFGFDPRAFDVALFGSPLQTRTVNLAIQGGSQGEQRATALAYLQHLQAPPKVGGAQACLVVLELKAGANFTNEHLIHPRAINIYDWPTTRFIARLTTPQMGLKQRVGRTGYAFAAMALHYMNVGMLSSSIFVPPIDNEALRAETIEDRRGLVVMPANAKSTQAVEKEIAASPSQPTVAQEGLLPSNSELLDELKAASPVKNVAMAYLVMPKISDLEAYTLMPDSIPWSGGEAPIVNMARPDLYREIYESKYWLDDAHLNERGAALVTKLIAGNLKNWYSNHGQPARCGG